MSELEDVLSIEGRVDREVQRRPELLPVVAELLVPYRDGAVGWFDAFEAFVREETGADADSAVLPTVKDALAGMADRVPVGRERALRLFALTALSRAVAEYAPDGDGAAEVHRALLPLTTTESEADASVLHSLIAGHDFRPIEMWGDLLTRAGELGVLDQMTAAQTVPPCAAGWRDVTVGGATVPATLLTTFEFFPGLTLDNVEHFLDPGQWPHCHPFWCSMTPVNPAVPNHRLYVEVVSLDCYAPALNFTTILEFRTVRTAATATTGARVDMQYWMWNGPAPPQGDGRIIVDEGFITASETASGLYLQTAKLVAFRAPFPGPFLAMIMCPLGYASQGEYMVYSCAVPAMSGAESSGGGALVIDDTHDEGLGARLVRHGGDPDLSVIRPSSSGSTSGSSASTASTSASTLVDAVAACGKDAAQAYAVSYDKMQKGTYSPADAVVDGMTWWSRLMRDVGLVAAAARAGGRRPTPPPPSPPEPGATT